MGNERKYLAISIKHTENGWEFGMPCCLWGYHRTKDGEERCFAGYTELPKNAELYALGDFTKDGYPPEIIKDDAPVKMEFGLCRKWNDYDTVLVAEEDYLHYCKVCDIPAEKGDLA